MLAVKSGVKNILVVEDDRDMKEIYLDMFSDQKDRYKIEVEDDATVALQRLREDHYDLIILDIIMTPMTGDTFFVYVRSDEKMKDIPILVVSVLSPYSLERLKKINHVDFLQKPITKEELLKKIEKMLG